MDYSRSCGYWQIFHHGTIRIKRGVRLSDGTRPDGVMYINDVAMNKWTARRINLAIKQRGNNLTIYKDIVKALQPQNISLQIEEVRSS